MANSLENYWEPGVKRRWRRNVNKRQVIQFPDFLQISNMATSTIDANPGDTSILEDDHDPDLSLETSDDPVSAF